MNTYHLFISHSWNYSDSYDRLNQLLKAQPSFNYRNFLVPQDNPILDAANDAQLALAIENKILRCSAVLIMAGVYATHSRWINQEIEIAQRLGKPIIAVKPFGAERISTVVRKAANAECAWNSESVIRAIRLHA